MRPTHGLQLQANYVWSRSVDDLSSEAGVDSHGAPTLFMNPFNYAEDKGRSDFNAAQVFVMNAIYDLPSWKAANWSRFLVNGWQLGSILTLSTGYPFTALTGFCQSNVTISCGADRPNLAPGMSNNPVLGGPNEYFNPAAFALQQNGTFGNAGRNTLIGPGLANLDFSLYKMVTVKEGKNLQIRAEVFNIFNRPNFALPALNLFQSNGAPTGNAGVITQTVTSGRQIQFGVKLNF